MIKNEIWYELKRKWYREKILKLLDNKLNGNWFRTSGFKGNIRFTLGLKIAHPSRLL